MVLGPLAKNSSSRSPSRSSSRRIRHRLFVEDESPAAFLEEPRKHGASQELPGRADTDVVTPATGSVDVQPPPNLDQDHETV